jgi:hypothetical protein
MFLAGYMEANSGNYDEMIRTMIALQRVAATGLRGDNSLAKAILDDDHHIFAQEFKQQFKAARLKHHRLTVSINEMMHASLHYGERGGEWNRA